MKTKTIGAGILAVGAVLFLGACVPGASGLLDNYAAGIFQEEDINMVDRNNAAADYIAQQAKEFIKPRNIIVAEAFVDRDEPDIHAQIGNILPEQLGVRFSQLGYRVDLAAVSTGADGNYLSPGALDVQNETLFILSGSYLRGRRDLNVNVKLVDSSSGQVVAAYDYNMPLTREVARLAQPKTQIMKAYPADSVSDF